MTIQHSAGGALLIAAVLATSEVRAQPVTAIAMVSLQSTDITPPDTPRIVEQAPLRVHHHAKGDPLEGLNRKLFAFHERADKAFFRPLALLYQHIIPKVLRTAMRHILSNLNEPIVFANDVLQLKPKHAAKTFSRFVINSTVGIGGAIDIAKTADLPHHDNSLADTLAIYGIGPGPYLFIPFYGPTFLRGLISGQAENLVYPVAIGNPFNRIDYQVSAGLVAGFDLRAESDPDFKALLDGAADPYATLRSVYMQARAAEIAELKGRHSPNGLEDPLADPEPPSGDQATPPTSTTPAADVASPAGATVPAAAPPADATPAAAPPVDATSAPAQATPSAPGDTTAAPHTTDPAPPPASKTAPKDSKVPDPDKGPSAL